MNEAKEDRKPAPCLLFTYTARDHSRECYINDSTAGIVHFLKWIVGMQLYLCANNEIRRIAFKCVRLFVYVCVVWMKQIGHRSCLWLLWGNSRVGSETHPQKASNLVPADGGGTWDHRKWSRQATLLLPRTVWILFVQVISNFRVVEDSRWRSQYTWNRKTYKSTHMHTHAHIHSHSRHAKMAQRWKD